MTGNWRLSSTSWLPARAQERRARQALKKKRQQAEEKIAADTITGHNNLSNNGHYPCRFSAGEASSMVDELIAKA